MRLMLIAGNRSSTDEQRASGDIPEGDDTTVVEPEQGNGQSRRRVEERGQRLRLHHSTFTHYSAIEAGRGSE